MAGLGRDPPAAGRGPPGRAAGRGIPPSLLVNGLLPGRGPAGRGGAASRLVNGLLPGRGPAGRAGAAAAAAGSITGSAGAGATGGATAAATTAGTGSATGGASTGVVAAGAAAVFFAAVFLAAVFLAGAGATAGKTSFNFRTTGGSTVDDADRTNSPMSCSLARTTLLSTPSSLASSYTRTLATALLSLVRAGGAGPLVRRHAHRCALIAFSSPSVLPSIRGLTYWPCSRAIWFRTWVRSSAPVSRKALGNARRCSARSRHSG